MLRPGLGCLYNAYTTMGLKQSAVLCCAASATKFARNFVAAVSRFPDLLHNRKRLYSGQHAEGI